MPEMPAPVNVFCIYSPEDRQLYQKLEKHLAMMLHQKRITLWHTQQILAGANHQQEITNHLEQAEVILMLISSSFMAKNYDLMERALKRDQTNRACVIPILLKALDWQNAPFAYLKILPSNRQPVTSWGKQDDAFVDIVTGLNRVLDDLPHSLTRPTPTPKEQSAPRPLDAYSQPAQIDITPNLQDADVRDQFDVFLCHHSPDKPAVKRIGEQLLQRGIRPWLDEWELRPGQSWQRALEEQIESIKAAAVFVGPSDFGLWQQWEADAFLREFVRRHCPVIPVLLPDIPGEVKPQLPVFLSGMTWVDFRKTKPDPLDQLIWGITGQRPGR